MDFYDMDDHVNLGEGHEVVTLRVTARSGCYWDIPLSRPSVARLKNDNAYVQGIFTQALDQEAVNDLLSGFSWQIL